jgi:hypothetical protein
VTPVEEGIDGLYKGPLADFIAGRTALARTLKGSDAQRVKAQQKPRVGPWAVNQLYWHARPLWDRVAKSGEKLRAEQIAALKGRRADLRAATEAHHNAVAAAVAQALRFAVAEGVQPAADELARTFEALSLAREWPEPPGRLTRPLQPAGFEALAGVVVKPRVGAPSPSATTAPAPRQPARWEEPARGREGDQKEERRKQAAVERRKQAARQKAEAAVARAEAAVARAEATEARARRALERARHDLERAQYQAASLSKVGS